MSTAQQVRMSGIQNDCCTGIFLPVGPASRGSSGLTRDLAIMSDSDALARFTVKYRSLPFSDMV
jgi:hypothetical protein